MTSCVTLSDFELSPTNKQDHVPVLYDIYVRSAAAKCDEVCTRETCNDTLNKLKASRFET